MIRNFGKFIGVGVFLFLASSIVSSAGAEGMDSWYGDVQRAESATVTEPRHYEQKSESREVESKSQGAITTLAGLKEAAETELQREIAYQESAMQAVATASTTASSELISLGGGLSMESPPAALGTGTVGASTLGGAESVSGSSSK